MIKNTSLILLIFLLSSCETARLIKYYQPVMLGSSLTYMPKPSSFDSVKVSNYISGGYAKIVPPPATKTDVEDVIHLAHIALNRAHCFKNINIAYGIDGFGGSYHNSFLKPGKATYFKNKDVYSFQLKTSVNKFITTNSYDFRIIGVDFMYAKEYGSFSKFRGDILGQEDVYSIPQTGLFSAGLSTEILFRGGRSGKTRYGGKLALHNTFGNLKYQGFDTNGGKENSLQGSAAFFLQLNKYFFILEGGDKASRINAGYRF